MGKTEYRYWIGEWDGIGGLSYSFYECTVNPSKYMKTLRIPVQLLSDNCNVDVLAKNEIFIKVDKEFYYKSRELYWSADIVVSEMGKTLIREKFKFKYEL